METVFIVTEANESVATGHLMECIVCGEELERAGYEISFWINDDMKDKLKERITSKFQEYHKSIESDYGHLLEQMVRVQPKAILFNLRKISEEFLNNIRRIKLKKTMLICIDEFGYRNLPADIIINPMIDSHYWFYGESKARLFCGAEYLVLPRELEEFHSKEKKISSEINKIVITMGGVDPQNYTAGLAEIVPNSFPEADIDIILGGGNSHREEILSKVIKSKKIFVAENVSDLLERIYEADLIFCAGGNTLHEAACIGTPAIILPSMPHEKRTAKCFEKKGFGVCANTNGDWENEIINIVDNIKCKKLRRIMSFRGKNISDGLGRKRIIEVIKGI